MCPRLSAPADKAKSFLFALAGPILLLVWLRDGISGSHFVLKMCRQSLLNVQFDHSRRERERGRGGTSDAIKSAPKLRRDDWFKRKLRPVPRCGLGRPFNPV